MSESVPVEIIRDTELKKWLVHKMNESRPTDEMIFKHEMLDKLDTYWEEDYTDGIKKWIPADIVWANTIPIKDCRFYVHPDESEEAAEGAVLNDYARVVVFNDFMDIIKDGEDHDDDGTYQIIGVVAMKFPDHCEIVMPFGVSNNNDMMVVDKALMLRTNDKKLAFKFEHKNADEMFSGGCEELWDIMTKYLSVWYGMQLALLHPQVKEVFNHSTDVEIPTPTHTNKNKKQQKKTKIKYIKRHVIEVEEIDEAMKRTRMIYKKCWYVTGHWRNQKVKNGHKKIFIQGYWKGVLRDLKNADIREREVVINTDGSESPVYYPNFE